MEFDTDFHMKVDLIKLWDEGKIKLGQRVPMMKYTTSNLFDKDVDSNTNFEELIITESLIKRLRTEIRDNWR